VHGYTTAFTFSAIVLAAAAILAFALIRASRHSDTEEASAENEETVPLPVPA